MLLANGRQTNGSITLLCVATALAAPALDLLFTLDCCVVDRFFEAECLIHQSHLQFDALFFAMAIANDVLDTLVSFQVELGSVDCLKLGLIHAEGRPHLTHQLHVLHEILVRRVCFFQFGRLPTISY